MNQIFGVPASDYEYEFMVIIPCGNGDFRWYSNHEDVEAYDIAQQVNGIVAHNVKISHKQKKKST